MSEISYEFELSGIDNDVQEITSDIDKIVDKRNAETLSRIQSNASGGVLQVRTGNLLRSIDYQNDVETQEIVTEYSFLLYGLFQEAGVRLKGGGVLPVRQWITPEITELVNDIATDIDGI